MPAKRKEFSTVRAEEHVISEGNGRRSREQILLDAPAARILAGTVLAKLAANGRYKPYVVGGAGGLGVPAAILAPTEDPSDPVGHIRTSAHVRECEINGHKIFWPAGITDVQKAAAEALLAEQGILVRY